MEEKIIENIEAPEPVYDDEVVKIETVNEEPLPPKRKLHWGRIVGSLVAVGVAVVSSIKAIGSIMGNKE